MMTGTAGGSLGEIGGEKKQLSLSGSVAMCSTISRVLPYLVSKNRD